MAGKDVKQQDSARTNLLPLPETTRGPFRAHGEASNWVLDRLVFFELTGPFNKEFFQALDESRRRLAPSRAPHGPYANIVTVRGSLLMSLEALDTYAHYVSGVRAVATAHVIAGDVLGRSLVLPQIERIYQAAGKQWAAFHTIAEAVPWAESLLSRIAAEH
jgi:hypothetical protein